MRDDTSCTTVVLDGGRPWGVRLQIVPESQTDQQQQQQQPQGVIVAKVIQ